MRKLILAVFFVLTGPAWAQNTSAEKVLDAAVNLAIRPGMVAFKQDASGLESAMSALCANPSKASLEIAYKSFAEAATAYGRIEFIRVGPLLEDNRAERLLFFPDRKGIGLKQVQAILSAEDPSAIDVASLRSKSVAAQGFGALEFVLYGTGLETTATADGAFRCQYGRTIAANISDIADELAHGWYAQGGVAEHLMRPSPEYGDYRTPVEALEEIVGLVSHGIEATRDQRLKPFMAEGDNKAKPKQALFWRSGLTMAMVRANIEGMRDLVALSGVGRAVGEKDQGLDNSIAFEFRNAERALGLIPSGAEDAVEDPKQVQALNYLVLVTASLQALVGEQLSTALGLSVGFSSLDGD
jgi:predicted lipoprotein